VKSRKRKSYQSLATLSATSSDNEAPQPEVPPVSGSSAVIRQPAFTYLPRTDTPTPPPFPALSASCSSMEPLPPPPISFSFETDLEGSSSDQLVVRSSVSTGRKVTFDPFLSSTASHPLKTPKQKRSSVVQSRGDKRIRHDSSSSSETAGLTQRAVTPELSPDAGAPKLIDATHVLLNARLKEFQQSMEQRLSMHHAEMNSTLLGLEQRIIALINTPRS